MLHSDPQSAVDVTGPLFLSYRQFDGTKIVERLAWLLRAAGVPVWRDQDDLPPGDTDDRLTEALDDGLSGGVLVVTPDVANSRIVRQIEAEELIRLHRGDSRFQLLVANDVVTQEKRIDYGAPDRLLSRVREELRSVDQRGTTEPELLRLVARAVTHRMTQHRDLVATAGHFAITVQTRNVGQVYDRTGAQLDIRVRRSLHERLPSAAGLRDLQKTLPRLPDAVVTSGSTKVQLTGGAHLSVAFAIGAALPSSRIGTISVLDQRGEEWQASSEAVVPSEPLLSCDVEEGTDRGPGRPRVAVYVDLLPSRSDAAFRHFLSENRASSAAIATIRSLDSSLLSASSAEAIAAEMVGYIRELAGKYDNAKIDLMLRCPFPIAVLAGRLSNTLRLRLYEWDDTVVRSQPTPRYVPTLELYASAPGGPITSVLVHDDEAPNGGFSRALAGVRGLWRRATTRSR